MMRAVPNREFMEWIAYFNMLAQREELEALRAEARANARK